MDRIGHCIGFGITMSGRRRDIITRATRSLERSFASRRSLAETASLLGISDRHLRELFRVHTGRSPAQYVRSLRIDKAKQLLAGGMPVKQVAVEAGFFDQSHLNRHFKHAVGLTPAQYARRFGSKA